MGLCIPADWKQLITLQVVLLARGFCWRIPENCACEIPQGAVGKVVRKSTWFGPHARNHIPLLLFCQYQPQCSFLFFFKDTDERACLQLLQGLEDTAETQPHMSVG